MTYREYYKDNLHYCSIFKKMDYACSMIFKVGTGESRDKAYEDDIYYHQDDDAKYYKLTVFDFFNWDKKNGWWVLKSNEEMMWFLYDAHLFYIMNVNEVVANIVKIIDKSTDFDAIDRKLFARRLEDASEHYKLKVSEINPKDMSLCIHAYNYVPEHDTYLPIIIDCMWESSDEEVGASPFFYPQIDYKTGREIKCVFTSKYVENIKDLKPLFKAQYKKLKG